MDIMFGGFKMKCKMCKDKFEMRELKRCLDNEVRCKECIKDLYTQAISSED